MSSILNAGRELIKNIFGKKEVKIRQKISGERKLFLILTETF